MRPARLTRAEQQAQTRERLLAAAERVFARHGYGGASIDLISAEAGYSKGAIYSNFESKEEVFLELARVYMERRMTELEDVVGGEPSKLAGALSQWLQTMQVDGDCLMLVTELQLQARRSPTFAAQYYALQQKQTRAMAAVLERFFKALGASMPMDPIDLADAMLALTHGITLQRPEPKAGSSADAGRVIDKLMKSLTRADKTRKKVSA
ncbi:MAG: TetR/AcrR family transcriptional regulator [Micropepsaceae bacterium]